MLFLPCTPTPFHKTPTLPPFAPGHLPKTDATALPLRVATVAAGPNGPTFTLGGQLNSVADLHDAMVNSPDLVAALTPEEKATLQGVDSAALDESPDLIQYVGECPG